MMDLQPELPLPPPPLKGGQPYVPARMVNEFQYCPRLAYLEWVQGEWAESADTVEGRGVHRRVDRGSGELPDPDSIGEDERIHARSVTLSSDRFGLIARLDLIEVEDGAVVPVDYKRGRRPHIAAGAWDPERVQLCVQVVHPCDQISIEGVVEAARLGLIAPILVGPPARIRDAAERAEAAVSDFPIEESPHSHDSAAKAVELVRQGKAEALMKGSLHTDELMGAVVARETGIRTSRRISHCFVMDVPGHKDPLIITDAAVNIAPTLADKVDIVQNAIDLGRALGFQEVRVAIMSAMETVNPAVPSTIEAAALCKMADRAQITGGILDGPLALDNAINEEAAAIKHIVSPVAGRANLLVVPDLEAGNMLAKSLSFLAGAAAAGIVLGARVPIILTSRADSVITRLASCAVASLVADARRKSAAAAIR